MCVCACVCTHARMHIRINFFFKLIFILQLSHMPYWPSQNEFVCEKRWFPKQLQHQTVSIDRVFQVISVTLKDTFI